MTTTGFFTALFIGCFAEVLVLCVCVPVLMWARNATALKRAEARQLKRSNDASDDAAALLTDIYSEIRTGNVVAPKEIEDRVLDVRMRMQETRRAIR